jgi:hypothetical protein
VALTHSKPVGPALTVSGTLVLHPASGTTPREQCSNSVD